MSDRELLENLAKISERCRTTECDDCKFNLPEGFKGHNCAIAALGDFLAASPCDWRMDNIEELLIKLGE